MIFNFDNYTEMIFREEMVSTEQLHWHLGELRRLVGGSYFKGKVRSVSLSRGIIIIEYFCLMTIVNDNLVWKLIPIVYLASIKE